MPFKRHSSYRLTLAVLAAMPATLFAAESEPVVRPALWTCTMETGQDWNCDTPDRLNPPPPTPEENTVSQKQESKPQASVRPQRPLTGTWVCQAGSEGGWDCSGNSAKELVTAAAPAIAEQPATQVQTETTEQRSRTSASTERAKIDSRAKAVAIADLSQTQHAGYDWYPVRDSDKVCHGVYVEPDYLAGNQEDKELRIDADRSDTQLGGLTTLDGNVELRQANRFFRSDSAEVDQVTNQIRMQGDIRYREPGLLLRGERAITNAQTGETVISEANYVIHERSLRGEARQIYRLQDNRVRMEESTFTTCAPDDNSWKIASESLVLDPNRGFGTAKHATFRVADTPIFYFPYLEFPIDDQRHTGFLFPTLGYSDTEGLEVAAPYYFNLAPNYDDTLTPKVLSKRGLLLENEFRHMNSYGSQSISTAVMPNDNKANRDRWLVGLDHKGYSDNWTTEIDFNAVSDDDYFDDLGSSLEVDRSTHLDRLATATYTHQNWQASLRVHDYQTIDSSKSPYQRLPQLQVEGEYNFYSGQEISLGYLLDTTQFDRNIDGLTGIDRVTGSRLHIQPTIGLPVETSWGYVHPEATLWLSQYQLNDQIAGEDDSMSVNSGILSIDSGLYFERQSGNNVQTLEPRLFALYSQEEEQQGIPDFDTSLTDFSYQGLFRKNRFSGLDKLGDSQQLSTGISSAFYRPDGSEMSRFSLGQAYYFADRKVQLNGDTSVDTSSQSNYAAEAYWNPSRDVRVSLDTELGHNDMRLVESNAKVSYTPSLNKAISLSYRKRDDLRNQVDLSFIWPVAPEWTVLGRWQKDLEYKQTPEALLGLEYASCCWKVRFAARRWIEDDSNGEQDSAVYLQFVLKGLGEVGNGDALKRIIGFNKREENNDY